MLKKLLTAFLIISAIGNVLLAYILLTREAVDYKAKYGSLKTAYVSLAISQKNLLEVFMKNQAELKSLVPEYKDLTKDQFDEAIRRKIVKLDIEIKDLGKNE